MAYRPDWYAKESGGASVLDLAQTLHDYCSGKADVSPEQAASCAKCLEWVLDNWRDDPRTRLYDRAVNVLLWRALADYAKEQKRSTS